MDYYGEPRQYNALNEDRIKFPTRTHLTGVGEHGGLTFSGSRERADVDIAMIPYQDQKEFFRLDREHD